MPSRYVFAVRFRYQISVAKLNSEEASERKYLPSLILF